MADKDQEKDNEKDKDQERDKEKDQEKDKEKDPEKDKDKDQEKEKDPEKEEGTPATEKPQFNFVFDDEPKKKKKKKSKKKKKDKFIPTKQYYEERITLLNARLADLRKQFLKKNAINRNLVKTLVNIEEDRVDVSEHLERVIDGRKGKIIELQKTLETLKIECEEYKTWSQERILELQKRYDKDHNTLQSEIQLQTLALRSLDSFREEREAALAQFDAHHDGIAELERKTKEDLFNMEQKAVVHKNALKKEVKERIEQLVKDFLHSNEIRNAGYTRGLIHENITLKKRLEKLVKQNIRAMEVREKQHLKTKETMESYTSLEQLSEQLRRTIENKDKIIEKLLGRIDRLRMRYVDARRYRRLYNFAKERGLFDKKGPRTFQEVTKVLERLSLEKTVVIQCQRGQENEIRTMREALDKLHISVEGTILTLKKLGPRQSLDVSDRRFTISELIYQILCDPPNQTNETSIYHPGTCGLIPLAWRKDKYLKYLYRRSAAGREDLLNLREQESCDKLTSIEEDSTEKTPKSPKEFRIDIPKICTPMMPSDLDIKMSFPPDAIKMHHQFENCFANIPSMIVMEGESDFMVSNDDLLKKNQPFKQ